MSKKYETIGVDVWNGVNFKVLAEKKEGLKSNNPQLT
tara:strand:- start:2255 stop:2365 length:111 start_codon:yes stop_codon:yes gene_type:complete